MTKHILFSILSFALFSNQLRAQDSLICMVNDQLISVSQTNAGVTNYIPLTGIPAGFGDLHFTWAAPHHCYYAIADNTGSGDDEIVRIDPWGNWANMGPITVTGQTVYEMEGIAFNPADNSLYVTASLNGGNPTDYWSETLLKVNVETMTGTIIGTFSHSGVVYEAEADLIAFSPNGTLYYNDTEPGGPEFKYFYEQDLAFANAPVLLHDEYYTTGAVNGLTFKDDKLYFIVDRDLREYDTNTGIHTNIGTMFTSGSFAGEVPMGLTWITYTTATAQINENDEEAFEVNIYPNPTNGIVNVQIDGIQNVKSFKLLNVLGEEILRFTDPDELTTFEIEAPNGLYFLEIRTSGDKITTSKLIKQ